LKIGADLTLFKFNHTVRVRWAESDIQRVVFNGHYLTYFDIGLTEYLRAMFDGSKEKLHGLFEDLYVVKSTVEYHAPAHFDEDIDVRIRTARVGRTSVIFELAITRDSDHLVSGELVYVHAPGGTPTPVPQALKALLEQFDQ
jgi:acyl-CoA thioester hydrolase